MIDFDSTNENTNELTQIVLASHSCKKIEFLWTFTVAFFSSPHFVGLTIDTERPYIVVCC